MSTATTSRTINRSDRPVARDLHAQCWREAHRISALGVPLAYVPAGEDIAPRRLIECAVCGDRWAVGWGHVRLVPVLRRRILAAVLLGKVATDGAA